VDAIGAHISVVLTCAGLNQERRIRAKGEL
jgi:hypothetical protein